VVDRGGVRVSMATLVVAIDACCFVLVALRNWLVVRVLIVSCGYFTRSRYGL
jgi:hypothetical protein